ncbi:hypothetical protein OQA88_9725 [Cercophora sp. LCS_1]
MGPKTRPQNSALCKACFSLETKALYEGRNENYSIEDPDKPVWIPSLKLDLSARNKKRGRPICALLRDAAEAVIYGGGIIRKEELPKSPVKYDLALPRYCNPTDGSPLRFYIRCALQAQQGGLPEVYACEIYTQPDKAAKEGAGQSLWASNHVPTRQDAEACAGIIGPWVELCTSQHESCWPTGFDDPPLPTRVLNVSDTKVALIESQGGTGRYIALTHCWGGSQPLITARESLAARRANIDWDSLPETFQDAILVTRALGISYIWINSLCIIQNDAADWEVQSASMADIYAPSSLASPPRARLMPTTVSWATDYSFSAISSPVKTFLLPHPDPSQSLHVRLALEPSHQPTFKPGLSDQLYDLPQKAAPLLRCAGRASKEHWNFAPSRISILISPSRRRNVKLMEDELDTGSQTTTSWFFPDFKGKNPHTILIFDHDLEDDEDDSDYVIIRMIGFDCDAGPATDSEGLGVRCLYLGGFTNPSPDPLCRASSMSGYCSLVLKACQTSDGS